MDEELENDAKTILIVDDEQPIVDILVYNLQKEGYKTIEAGDGLTAVELATEKRPDLILLDIMLPKLDGLSVCKRIKNSFNVPIIMLTAKDGEIDKILGLELGADDYITKPFYTKELLSRISANLRRSKFNAGNIYKKGDIVVDFDRYKISRHGEELNISTNEFDIVKMLIENKGRVVRRDVIYEKIWDVHGNFVEYNTLTVAMSRIKAKLGTYGEKNQQYIETIRNVGYRWID